MTRKRQRYTDDFRASAVLMLEAAGYPEQKGALSRVAEHLGIHARTLSRWAKAEQNPPPDKLVSEKKLDLVSAIRHELASILGEMVNARPEADYRALATAFGILVDKLQLLDGGPTQRVENIVRYLDDLPDDEYDAVIREAEAIIHASSSRDSGGSAV